MRNEETQKAIEAYQKANPGITIDGQFSQFCDYWQKLATASAGNELPDVIQIDYSYLNQYVSSGLLYDLSGFVSDGTMDTTNWNQSMINAGTVDGKPSNMYVGYLNVAQEGQELLMTTQPSKDPKKSNYLKPSMFYSVSRDAKDPKAAAAFIAWLTNSTEANDCLKGERGIPLNSTIADSVKAQLPESEQAIYTYVEDVVVDNSSDINPPDPSGNSEAVNVFNQVLEQLCYGQMTPEDAASQMISQGTAVLKAKASS